jgi:hypothetical protein
MSQLYFSNSNRKIVGIAGLLGIHKNSVFTFNQPAGYSCPAADICQSFADREDGKITDGDNCKFRCYAASLEAIFTALRKVNWRNFDALRGLSTDKMAELIISEMPKKARIIRIHSSGDFFNRKYFLAWVKVAESLPHIDFFGYTKVLSYVQYDKPDNFTLQYSMGGKMDDLHTTEPYAVIVETPEHAKKLGIPIACENHPSDDYLFIKAGISFALVVHGTQPKGSKFGKNYRVSHSTT